MLTLYWVTPLIAERRTGTTEVMLASHCTYWFYYMDNPPRSLNHFFTQPAAAPALNHGLEIVTVQDSFRERGDSSEPFGCRDSISQPPVRGLVGRRDQTEHPINTGEFVVG